MEPWWWSKIRDACAEAGCLDAFVECEAAFESMREPIVDPDSERLGYLNALHDLEQGLSRWRWLTRRRLMRLVRHLQVHREAP